MDEWKWWDELHGGDQERNAWGWPHYDELEVARFIEDNTFIADNVLDLGCGPGRLGHRLARRNPWVEFHGIDVSQNMVTRSTVDAPENWTAFVTDGRTLPNLPYSTVYSVTVFQHIPDDVVASYVEQARRRLIEGGHLIFTYAVGDESAPRSYQTTHKRAEEWCAEFNDYKRLDTPDTHPAWNWAVAYK